MARTVTPIPLTWAGLELTCTRITDRFGKRWVKHHGPGALDAQLEDMGPEAPEIMLDVVLWGDGWFVQYEELRDRVELTLPGSTGKLEHPYWGAMYGAMTNIEVVHRDDQHDFAVVRLTFVAGVAAEFEAEPASVLSTAAAQARTAIAAARAALEAL